MASLGLMLALTIAGAYPTLIKGGGDPAPGLLLNRSVGLRPFDPPDPARPTIVFIHGINPLPGVVHFTMGERLGEAIARRYGHETYNVLDWDWNAVTIVSLRHKENVESAIAQGRRLAEFIQRAGLDPARLHLIGHSAGGIVAASAARSIARSRGVLVAQVTFLDPAGFTHATMFEELAAVSSSRRVENYWTPGPSAFGRVAGIPGVIDVRVDGRTPLAGIVRPSRSGHLEIVRWYIATVENPMSVTGFNTSQLVVH